MLPLIPLALISTGTLSAAGGVLAGVFGGFKLREAQALADKVKAGYATSLGETHVKVNVVNGRIRRYGKQQAHARRHVVIRMADFVRRNQRQVSQSAAMLLDGLEVDIRQMSEFEGALTADVGWLGGAATAAATGVGTWVGIPVLAQAVGTASTGTAITTLSGAAAQSATMAWLGGGSVAAGGGGVALGATALNFVTIGPAVLVGGLVLNGKGEQALTRARDYEAEVNLAIEKQVVFRSRLSDVEVRVRELSVTLRELVRRAQAALHELEQAPFDPGQHAELFRRAMRLTFAVRDFCQVKILDDEGALNTETEELMIKYRKMA